MNYHNLLNKQIRKHLPDELLQNEHLITLLNSVSETYKVLERDKILAERAFKISEQEYVETNQRLSYELRVKELSLEKLNQTFQTITGESTSAGEDLLSITSFIHREINNRKSAEVVFHSLIKSLNSGILLEDENRIIRFANKQFCELFDIPLEPDQLQGIDCAVSSEQSSSLFIRPEKFLEEIDEALESREPRLNHILVMKSGKILQRDYIPIFIEGKYQGHLWNYTDVTEAKESEKILLESELRNRLIMNAALDAIIQIDSAGKITFWNPQAEHIFGWKKSEILGKTLQETIIPSQHREAHTNAIYHHNPTSESRVMNRQMELPAIDKQGRQLTIELYIIPIVQNDQRFFVSFIRDISERKILESEKERLSLVASANVNGVLFIDKNQHITWVNDGLVSMTGYSPEELIGRHPFELFIGPKSREMNQSKLLEEVKARKQVTGEFILYRKDSSYIWTRANGQVINDSDDGAIYFFMIEDISREKEAQDMLNQYEERLRFALNNVGDNYWEHDFTTGKTEFSNLKGSLLGYDFAEINDKSSLWWSCIHPDDRHLLEESDSRYLSGLQDQHNMEYRVIYKDGSVHWVLDRGVVTVFDDNGKPAKIIGTHIDITSQKAMEEELKRAKDAAEASTRAKEIFLANMSHEIRTPMNAIIGMAGQLIKTPLDSIQQSYLGNIQTASDHLLIIINDLLDLSKIEAGQLTLEKIGFEPQKVLQRAIQVLHLKAEEKGLTLRNSYYDPRIADVIIGDPFRLNQILLNLISNSIKFTEKGGVEISCGVIEETEKEQVIEIVVSDTGIGMDEKFVNNLFQKFRQEDESITRKFGGTGLGMSICKELVELMGGEIHVESQKNVGTRVIMNIPFRKGSYHNLPELKKEEADISVLKGKDILVVDDNEMNRLVASTILGNYGVHIVEAENGLQALEKLENNPIDLILMDVQMPVMDGLQATLKIREAGNKVPVIALTAFALKGDESKFYAAGMDDYLTKPFNEEQLLNTVARCMSNNPSNHMTRANINTSGSAEPLYDLSYISSLGGGSSEFVGKMVDLFLNLAHATLSEMNAAYEEDNLEQLSRLAHRLKPSLDNLRIQTLHGTIRDIETNAQEYGKGEKLKALLDSTESAINEVVTQLKKEFSK